MKKNDALLQVHMTLDHDVARLIAGMVRVATAVFSVGSMRWKRNVSKSLAPDDSAHERSLGVTSTQSSLTDERDDAESWILREA